MTEQPESSEPRLECRVCGRGLPFPSVEKLEHGGRPRLYCGPYCRLRACRRNGTIKRLLRWTEIAERRGVPEVAMQFRAKAEALRAMPWRHASKESRA